MHAKADYLPDNAIFIELGYKPRDYQESFEKALFAGKKRALLVWHRRAGKDIATLNFMIHQMIYDRVGIYYYFFPTFAQGRTVLWDGIDEDGKPIMDAFPKAFIDGKPNQSEMKIRLKNGSLFQIIGTDNYDRIAGTNPVGVVFSEYSLQDPMCWQLIVSPILAKNGGWAVFNGTPRGKNHQYELDIIARNNPKEWFYQKLNIEDTGLIPLSVIEQERREGKSEELIQQEYYCSYDRGVEGSYYARLIEKARREGRIGRVLYEPRSDVSTAWDIGYGDSTAIIFFQEIGAELRIIDYYEAHGEGLAHYLQVLQSKPYAYGRHFFPHDAGSGSIQTGMSLQRYALDLGLKAQVLKRDNFEIGIEACRAMLASAFIDEFNCKQLLKCLESYHKKYNDKMACYSNIPEHNWASHGADAARYLAMARIEYGRGSASGGLTPDKIAEMRMRNLGY